MWLNLGLQKSVGFRSLGLSFRLGGTTAHGPRSALEVHLVCLSLFSHPSLGPMLPEHPLFLPLQKEAHVAARVWREFKKKQMVSHAS